MNSLQILFNNIERFYTLHRVELLEGNRNERRPSKTIPRDIFAAINKFKEYYIANQTRSISKEIIASEILRLSQQADAFVQNLRILREFEFGFPQGNEYILTDDFIDFCNGNISIEELYLKKLGEIHTLADFKMIYNATLCVLREGYIYNEIIKFPESADEFIQVVPSLESRAEFCRRVYDIYGFIGNYGNSSVDQGDYTPNANYRFISMLQHLELIENSGTTNPFTTYKLTEKGLLLLKKIDRNLSDDLTTTTPIRTTRTIPLPLNRIVFGAPGTGKSHRLEKQREMLFGGNYERVTFHPNYSYAQFVGTYKPAPCKDQAGKETITYKYVPGPFMRILIEAMRSQEPFLLLIEEINRANVAAVFGDVFQLLDRKDGRSEYEIETTEDVRNFLSEQLERPISEFERIRIPSNLYIWATMNSADQGVFPIDTAFKRRWDFEYIGVDDEKEDMKNVIVQLGEDRHDVRWNDLREKINQILSNECKLNEDKLLGPYFISKSIIEADDSHKILDNKKFVEAFESKVIMYLFDDAAKQKKSIIFAGCSDVSTYSKVCAEFRKNGEAIFQRGLRLEVQPQTSTETTE